MEKVNVLDKFGNTTKKIVNKDIAHKKKLLHPVVHIWIYNSNKEILIQKRAKDKKFYPNHWDVSCAGHISANESFLLSAKRELKEELGIKIKNDDLELIGIIKDNTCWKNICENNWAYVYILKYDKQIIQIQNEELSEVKWIPFKEFKNKTKNLEKNNFTKKENGYFEFIIAHLEEKFK